MAPLGNAVCTYGPVRCFELAYTRVLGVVYHRLLWVVGIMRCPYSRVPDTPKMSAKTLCCPCHFPLWMALESHALVARACDLGRGLFQSRLSDCSSGV